MLSEADELRRKGFTGFVPLLTLPRDLPPPAGGVYTVVRAKELPPKFLDQNPGGRFKGQDPTVPVDDLKDRWLADAQVMYIGKATNLRMRLYQFRRFGEGQPIGHWGGRFIWQLADSAELLIAWRPTPDMNPRAVELTMLDEFRSWHGRLPYANISG